MSVLFFSPPETRYQREFFDEMSLRAQALTSDFCDALTQFDETNSFLLDGAMSDSINFMDVKSALTWDEYFMLQAMLASYKSKDPSTKVGCVFVDDRNHQISMGYNGMIAGIDETQIPWGRDQSVSLENQKYGYVMHSEANAISHAPRSLEGSRGYVTLFPCNECAKLIASQRVGEIVYLSDKYADTAEVRIAKRIFDLSGVKYRHLELKAEIFPKLIDYLQTLANV